ncbi:hypothetical protein CEXT_780261 [Caerostris extrusa]|uniref:Uncharacterized protein n=1 Tax=Caerostris extrusa TaxID=172846 RepID=A0AAV4SBJ4_CAEEX|nr:hypothetical protein CEXT_780261 [Caerostris extrusa]
MFIIALLSCFALAHALSFVPVNCRTLTMPPSYEIRHAVRDHLGERVREEVGNPAVGVVAGSSRIADFRGVGRQVNYVADPSGLRAHIRTNEVAAAPIRFSLLGQSLL